MCQEDGVSSKFKDEGMLQARLLSQLEAQESVVIVAQSKNQTKAKPGDSGQQKGWCDCFCSERALF